MRGDSGSRRWWWLVARAALVVALWTGTWWLLTTEGAEIANVLALRVAVLGLLAAVGSVAVRRALSSRPPHAESAHRQQPGTPSPRRTFRPIKLASDIRANIAFLLRSTSNSDPNRRVVPRHEA